jgi:hypothetical protein
MQSCLWFRNLALHAAPPYGSRQYAADNIKHPRRDRSHPVAWLFDPCRQGGKAA